MYLDIMTWLWVLDQIRDKIVDLTNDTSAMVKLELADESAKSGNITISVFAKGFYTEGIIDSSDWLNPTQLIIDVVSFHQSKWTEYIS